MSILGSRQQMCLHAPVARAPAAAISQACHAAVQAQSCLRQVPTSLHCATEARYHPKVAGVPFLAHVLQVTVSRCRNSALLGRQKDGCACRVHKVEPFIRGQPDIAKQPLDIEDLMHLGQVQAVDAQLAHALNASSGCRGCISHPGLEVQET